MDVNAVVSFNVKTIRERRGLTQQQVADRLAELTGHRLPQASISAMERGFDGERRRRFDAHELYLLSVVFDVPIAYFFDDLPLEKMDRPEAQGIRSPSSGSSVQGPAFELKRETLELVRAYYRIRPRHLRNRLLDLIKKLADADARASAAAAQTAVTAQRQ